MTDHDNNEETVSMVDVLEEDSALEEEANAVLGGSDDQNCTYPNGYVDRQALYACLTCTPPDSKPAGICLACSLSCHDKHDLVELYTKRHFRCDCGNSRFSELTCKLYKDKADENPDNKYNQNFQGTYCTCKRPYPDPYDDIEDEMIQCVICEDWYHSRHLGVLPPADYLEMTCDSCIKEHEFLYYYKNISVLSGSKSQSVQSIQKAQTSENVDVVNPTSKDKENTKDTLTLDSPLTCAKETSSNVCSSADEKESTDVLPGDRVCKLEDLKQGASIKGKLVAMFWPSQWRKLLCKCDSCMKLYENKGITFLSLQDDTLEEYEAKAKSRQQSSYDNAINALGRMGRVQQVEMVQGFNDMRRELSEYLKQFAGQKRVVKKEDIEQFFEQLHDRKRRRRDDDSSIQMNCR